MPVFSGVADVLESQPRGLPPSDPFSTFQNLWATPSSESTADAQPSHKRRKLNTGEGAGLQPADAFNEDESVVLAKIAFALHFHTPPVNRNISEAAQVVSLESFSRANDGQFRLSMWTVSDPSKGVDILAAVSPDFLESIAPHLDIATSLARTSNGKKRSNKTQFSFCRCLLSTQPQDGNPLRLEIEIRWPVGVSVVESTASRMITRRELEILSRYFPDVRQDRNVSWSLSDFYDSVYIPPSDAEVSPRIGSSLTETKLYPFQQRAVDWLLQREGVHYPSAGGDLQPLSETTPSMPVSFTTTKDANEEACYVSQMRGLVIKNPEQSGDSARLLRGGILAEEMGLGKTVELVALMCLHKRRMLKDIIFDPYSGQLVKPSSATLIITPPSILEQWQNEINAHAPELKVFHYKGLPVQSAPKKDHDATTAENLMRYDVVLTTYQVLSREVHFAKPPPDRALRHEKQYEHRKSPLVEIQWWRTVLDEAQLVESGVSQAATVARIIPRCNAWAVSGTPLRKDVQDLRGLLTFLRYEPFAGCKPVWDRLDKPAFRAIFNQITLRHTKDKIRDELRLPPQKRVVITVPFTAIEEQNYTEMIRQMCDACGLSSEGSPLDDNHGPDHPEVIERMREWLVRLRQTCLHAHVGRRNRKALGAKNAPLRTVQEVLEVMIEQNDTSLKSEAREHILSIITQGHLIANAEDDVGRSNAALPFYEMALRESQSHVKSLREELASEKEKVAAASGPANAESGMEDQDSDADEERPNENLGHLPVIRKALRSFLELEHACKFFIGTCYYQTKSNQDVTGPESEDFHRLEKLETEWYDQAKAIRRELLRESQGRAQHQMKKISTKKPFHQIATVADLPDLGGIEGRNILGMMDNVADALNAQAEQIQKWRAKIVEILLMPLVDEDEGKETTGEEYEDSTRVQDELYVYIMALRTLVADRGATVNGLQDHLVEHELREAERQARAKQGHAPELVLEVVQTRNKLRSEVEAGSLKGVVSGIRSLLTSLQWRADGGEARAAAELALVQKQLAKVQSMATDEAKTLVELEKEQDLFRSAMNQRLEFYRQLQHISDTVAPYKEALDPTLDRAGFTRMTVIRSEKEKRIAGLKTKQAYLSNLRQENQQEDLKQDCIICQDEIEIGVLTSCGHKYCKVCINKWWYKHRTCPLCKQKLRTSDFKDINSKPSMIVAQEENHEAGGASQASSPSSSNTSIYSEMSDSTMKDIKRIDLNGSYGTKVDMIAKHLLWIRNNDPGAKSIIFSQFGDFLEVLRDALRRWKIGASSIADRNGIQKFRTDPAVECFLLDAKSDSSGLNLVNATYVFLCEPLINPAIELQAIARVHRIGQQRATTIFMYLVSDTVEETVYDISVERRLEHMGKGGSRSGTNTPGLQEKTLEAANSQEMEAAPLKQLLRKKGDGEIVQVDDLWKCLFGRKRGQAKALLEPAVNRHLRAEAAEKRAAEASLAVGRPRPT
ncbi:hypothetical protein BS50DRAFT_579125 [Corynespora cassiicola Philippines]|uniref:ATP-dependent DNA helicase n=1 Tax=Corynespora cassiicola Philippines TaxID=1448308 RepID=A0A2T2N5D7_CORCC|nr:hypothetical protein BS50DRAFT_579125 [Corynespora cassiicola Philippines]